MKNSFTMTSNMKRLLPLAFATAVLLTACKKDNSTAADTIADDEVAATVTASVAASSGGMVTQSESTAKLAATTTLSCGASSDTTINGASVSGAAITYSFQLKFSRSLICNNGIPSQFNASFAGNSSYTAPRMSSNDNTTALFTVSGLQPSASSYVLNESYVRNGTQQSSVRLQRSFSSTLTFTSTDVTVNKSTMKIVSGTASVQFTGTTSGGVVVTRGGTLTFLGNNQATLALNNGAAYPIAW